MGIVLLTKQFWAETYVPHLVPGGYTIGTCVGKATGEFVLCGNANRYNDDHESSSHIDCSLLVCLLYNSLSVQNCCC